MTISRQPPHAPVTRPGVISDPVVVPEKDVKQQPHRSQARMPLSARSTALRDRPVSPTLVSQGPAQTHRVRILDLHTSSVFVCAPLMLPKGPVLELVQPDQRHFCRNAYVTGSSVAAPSHSGGVIVVCVMLGALTLLHRVATAAQATAYHAWGSIRHRHRTRFYRWLARSLAKPTVLKILECE